MCQCTVYNIQTVYDWEGMGGVDCWVLLETIFCRSLTLSIWPDLEPTKLLDHPRLKPRRGGGLIRIYTFRKVPLILFFNFNLNFFYMTTFCIAFYQSNFSTPLSILRDVADSPKFRPLTLVPLKIFGRPIWRKNLAKFSKNWFSKCDFFLSIFLLQPSNFWGMS